MIAMLSGSFVQSFSITSYAATGTITKSSVNVRKEPSTSSEVVGNISSGDTVTVNSKITGSDGNVYYQVVVDSSTVGYIRSDLIILTGDVPEENGVTITSGTVAPTIMVTPIQLIGAKVTGNEVIRVRSNADIATDNIIAQLADGTMVMVNGQTTDKDGNTWYRVAFDNNGTAKEGFIRTDYLILSGKAVPVDSGMLEEFSTEEPSIPEQNDSSVTAQKYYVAWAEGRDGVERWYLFAPNEDNEDGSLGRKYKVEDMIKMAEEYDRKRPALDAVIHNQKIVIGILVAILFVGR